MGDVAAPERRQKVGDVLMMWDDDYDMGLGMGMGWGWLWVILILIGIGLLVYVAIRLSTSTNASPPAAPPAAGTMDSFPTGTRCAL